jgi:hypothetical protein
MAHAFGDLLRQYRARKAGLTLARLAHLAGYGQVDAPTLKFFGEPKKAWCVVK